MDRRAPLIVVPVIVALGMVAGLAGEDRPGKVRAESLEILDGEGRVRIRLEAGKDGAASVALLGSTGEARASLAIGAQGEPELILRGGDGRPRLKAAVGADDATVLAFLNSWGKPLGGLLQVGESLQLHSLGRSGKVLARWPEGDVVEEQQSGRRPEAAGDGILRGNGLRIADDEGAERLRIGTDGKGGIAVVLCDANGSARLRLSVPKSGDGIVESINEFGVTKARLPGKE